MALSARINRLEATVLETAPRALWSERGLRWWQQRFQEAGEEGAFELPDFRGALEEFSAALDRHEEAATLPEQGDTAASWPGDIWRAWEFLAELYTRFNEPDIPPVSEGEFSELAGWYERNRRRLAEKAGVNGWLEVADGKRRPVDELAIDVAKGPRSFGAGVVAQALRELRAAHGGGSL